MVHPQAIDDERHRRFAQLLKEARKSIPVDTVSLGNTPRIPKRIGKHVRQEELAEAIGISRVWYAKLEGAQPIRASLPVLQRVCDVLMLDEDRRSALFQLGLPELSPSAALRSAPIPTDCARIRSVGRRLWSASTIDETLEIAAEEVAAHFADADLVLFVQRLGDGRWRYRFVVDRGQGTQNAEMYADLASSLTPRAFDQIVLYPILSQPGDVGSRDTLLQATSVGTAYEKGLTKFGLTSWTFVHARVRSHGGITAGITVKHAHTFDYSDTDRAFIGAVGSIASLALS
jgi:transcriptional regulator with XRE-family HTH domain